MHTILTGWRMITDPTVIDGCSDSLQEDCLLTPHPRLLRISALCLFLFLFGCTTLGLSNPDRLTRIDFGPRLVVNLCLLLDHGITEQDATTLLRDAWEKDGQELGLPLFVSEIRRWERPGFTVQQIAAGLVHMPLPNDCDRMVAFIGRHAGDVLWGVLGMPEVLGWANNATRTHGYVVAQFASLNQVVTSPSAALRHESITSSGAIMPSLWSAAMKESLT